jgi:protein PhnA
MSIENELALRSESKCELCSTADDLFTYNVLPALHGGADDCIFVCEKCKSLILNPDKGNMSHWRCLSESMWSDVPAVKVIAWRILNSIRSEGWPQDLLDMLFLDDDLLVWAKAGVENQDQDMVLQHIDSNGNVLQSGDSVVITKNLDVKGANFTAKRGTAVRGISLVADNAEQIEGRVNGQKIVILTKFVKKST